MHRTESLVNMIFILPFFSSSSATCSLSLFFPFAHFYSTFLMSCGLNFVPKKTLCVVGRLAFGCRVCVYISAQCTRTDMNRNTPHIHIPKSTHVLDVTYTIHICTRSTHNAMLFGTMSLNLNKTFIASCLHVLSAYFCGRITSYQRHVRNIFTNTILFE